MSEKRNTNQMVDVVTGIMKTNFAAKINRLEGTVSQLVEEKSSRLRNNKIIAWVIAGSAFLAPKAYTVSAKLLAIFF